MSSYKIKLKNHENGKKSSYEDSKNVIVKMSSYEDSQNVIL